MTTNKDENSTKKSKDSKKIGRPKAKKTRLVISDEIYRKIARISEESRMPMQLVYEDALLNGIVTLKEMYSSAIEFRATRDGMINELTRPVVQERKPQCSQATELGKPSEPAYHPERDIPQPYSTENGSDVSDEQRGYETEAGEALESSHQFERGL
jgi:hypothetical protein